jgi:hypothetical protein
VPSADKAGDWSLAPGAGFADDKDCMHAKVTGGRLPRFSSRLHSRCLTSNISCAPALDKIWHSSSHSPNFMPAVPRADSAEDWTLAAGTDFAGDKDCMCAECNRQACKRLCKQCTLVLDGQRRAPPSEGWRAALPAALAWNRQLCQRGHTLLQCT